MSRFLTLAPPFEQAIPAEAAAVLTAQQLVQVLCLLPCTLLLLTRFRCRNWYPCIPPCKGRCVLGCRVSQSIVELHSRAPISSVLQAAAAARIQGKPDIFEAARSGDLSLVRDHLTADPSCVDRRDGE